MKKEKIMVTIIMNMSIIIALSIAVVVLMLISIRREKDIQKIVYVNTIAIDYSLYDVMMSNIKSREGLSLKAYEQGGKYYIGYGHQIRRTEQYLRDTSITIEYAEQLLQKDVSDIMLYVNDRYKLVGNKLIAVTMLAYNIGIGKLNNYIGDVLKAYIADGCDYNGEKLRRFWLSLCHYNNSVNKELKERREEEVGIFFAN